MPLSLSSIRRDFPFLLSSESNPCAYFDGAATAQTPQPVIDALTAFLSSCHGNVHRGMHAAATASTQAYEDARSDVARFLGARHSSEIIFTKNATESLNILAQALGKGFLQCGDVVVLSILEHHSNIVPWQMIRETIGIELAWIGLDRHGALDLEQLERTLQHGRVKIVSVTGLSNVLGILTPLHDITTLAHAHGALVVVDAAQLAAHRSINVTTIDCDCLVFSGHKVYGPTGTGVLYGKRELLKTLPPVMGGGSMVQGVTQEGFTPADLPQRFEAGTPPIAEAIALAAALRWSARFSWDDRIAHERTILKALLTVLQDFPGSRIFGPADLLQRAGCISFTIQGIHPHDLTDVLGQHGVHLRAGHHCAQPLHDSLGVPATARASVSVFNDQSDVALFAQELTRAITLLRP